MYTPKQGSVLKVIIGLLNEKSKDSRAYTPTLFSRWTLHVQAAKRDFTNHVFLMQRKSCRDTEIRWVTPVVEVDVKLWVPAVVALAQAFWTHWVARFGVPATVTSDRGRQFVSELWKKTATLLGASTNATTAYHPQANGLVERMHRTMKASLKAKLGSDPNWCDTLPVVLLGMRAAVKQDINCSVAEMVYGEQLRLPGEFFTTSAGNWNTDPSFVVDLRQRMQQVRPVPPVWHGEESRRSFVHTDLPTATHVFVRVDAHKSPLQATYKGPFKVLERHSKYFKRDLGNREDTVSIDRLKPAFMDEPLRAAPMVRDGARSDQTREPTSEAVIPHPMVSDTETEMNPVVTASGRLVKLPTRYRH